MNNNIGLYFYRSFFNNYFEHINANVEESDKDFAKWLHDNYKPILNAGFDSGLVTFFQIPGINDIDNKNSFSLTTLYPGLVCGVGYEHELGFTNEFKLGFLFDHTTGLPYIPGSSVKGVIRHYFGMNEYMIELLGEMREKIDDENDWAKRFDEPKKQKMKDCLIATNLKSINWKHLERTIFEGTVYHGNKEEVNAYSRDMFLDAYISGSDNTNGKILDDDYITSHQNTKHPELSPFTNPNPVRFLKVSSAVTFTFQFRLVDTQISNTATFAKEIKLELFRKILLDQGIGAKTNVGYGQFE